MKVIFVSDSQTTREVIVKNKGGGTIMRIFPTAIYGIIVLINNY
jgi:hypothetical protein